MKEPSAGSPQTAQKGGSTGTKLPRQSGQTVAYPEAAAAITLHDKGYTQESHSLTTDLSIPRTAES